jgi:hypothetical protein
MTPVEFHRLRLEQLEGLLKVVPAGVRDGSIQKVQRYKEWASKAHHLVKQGRRAKLNDLNDLINNFTEFQ